MHAALDEAAVADWEGEGGSIRAPSHDPVRTPSNRLERREAAFRTDRDLSYLGLSWLTCKEAPPDEGAGGTRLSYAEARNLWRPYLTVERFPFFVRMRDAFRTLRQVREADS